MTFVFFTIQLYKCTQSFRPLLVCRNLQNGVSPPNTWPKNKNCVLYDDTNAPPSVATTSTTLTDCCASNTAGTPVYSLGTNRVQTPPMGSPPPPYSSGGSITRGRRPMPAVSLNDCLDAFMLTEVLDGADRPVGSKLQMFFFPIHDH